MSLIISVDLKNEIVTRDDEAGTSRFPLNSAEAFALLSEVWLRCGWDTKYVYSFTWMGRPIIQLPEDMFRLQEVIYRLKPDVIIETGVAHGGSLIFYASLCKAMEAGRVVGIDIEIRPHNRRAIESHELSYLVTLIEGSSIDSTIVERVRREVKPDDKVIVLLDSCHTKAHVLAELNAYAPLVTVGSYIVAMDGIMEQVAGAPRTQADWSWNNPRAAAVEFVEKNPNFIIETPPIPFNEGSVSTPITYWPGGYIKRIN